MMIMIMMTMMVKKKKKIMKKEEEKERRWTRRTRRTRRVTTMATAVSWHSISAQVPTKATNHIELYCNVWCSAISYLPTPAPIACCTLIIHTVCSNVTVVDNITTNRICSTSLSIAWETSTAPTVILFSCRVK